MTKKPSELWFQHHMVCKKCSEFLNKGGSIVGNKKLPDCKIGRNLLARYKRSLNAKSK